MGGAQWAQEPPTGGLRGPTKHFLPLHGLRGFLSKTLLETRMHSRKHACKLPWPCGFCSSVSGGHFLSSLLCPTETITAPEASARTEMGRGGERAQRLFSRCSAWARVQRQNKPSQVDGPVPRPGVCQGGYPQSPDAPGGTEVLWGRRGAGGGDKEVQARGPKERNKAATCVCRDGGSAQPASHPRETPVPSGLHAPCGRAHWQAPGAQPDKTSSKWTETLDTRPSLGPASAQNPKQGPRGQRRRGEDAVPLQVAPVVASHTRVCPLLANPLPGPSHPGKTGQAPSLLGSPPPKGVGRGGLREPPGSEVPGFSVPVDGNPRNTGSQVGSVWSINTARKICCEHWLWAQLRPGPWLRSLQEGLAGSRRHSTVRSPQRGLAAACHCLSTTTFP